MNEDIYVCFSPRASQSSSRREGMGGVQKKAISEVVCILIMYFCDFVNLYFLNK